MGGKPWCPKHATQSPYALEVAARIADVEAERARVEAGGVPDLAHPFAVDVVTRDRWRNRQQASALAVRAVLRAAGLRSESGKRQGTHPDGLETRAQLGLTDQAVKHLRDHYGLAIAGRKGKRTLLYDPSEVEAAKARKQAEHERRAEAAAKAKRDRSSRDWRAEEARAAVARAERIAAERGALAFELRDPEARAIAEGAA